MTSPIRSEGALPACGSYRGEIKCNPAPRAASISIVSPDRGILLNHTTICSPAFAPGTSIWSPKLTQLSRPKLRIIDELGYLPFEANAAHLFLQLVSRRYEKGSILITSNRSVGEWGGVFGDPVAATAILDRLLHHSAVVTIRRDSYRLREERRLRNSKPTHHDGGQLFGTAKGPIP